MKALSVLKYVGFGILGAGLMVGVIFGVQALWNWLIPELFHGPELNFWQTVGIFFLSKILLTGIAPGPQHNQRKDWKRKCRQKYSQAPKEDLDTAAAEQV
jgi:hypothetical protein